MKKVLCIILCCVLILPLISGCNKKDSFEGTVWVSEKDETQGIEFLQNKKYRTWKLINSDSKYTADKKNIIANYGEPKDYGLKSENSIILYDLWEGFEYLECEIGGKYLCLKYEFAEKEIIQKYRKIESLKKHAEVYGLVLEE